MSGNMATSAQEQLNIWLEGAGRTQAMLAGYLEVGQSSVSLWAKGRSRPDAHLRRAMEVLLGIPATAWETDDERDLVSRVSALAVRLRRTLVRRPATKRTTSGAKQLDATG